MATPPSPSNLCLMSVHAHPDDETIQTGGTFLRYEGEGVRTVLVCATRGEEGEIHDPDLTEEEARPRLGEIRTGELACAAAKLGVDRVEHLGYRDSGMAGTPANQHPASFHQASLDEAAARLVALIRRYRPQVILSYPPNGNYGHPDHIKVHQVTREAFAKAGDASFAPSPDLPPWQPLKLYESTMPREAMLAWIDRRRTEAAAKGEPFDENERWFDLERDTTPFDQITVALDTREYRAAKVDALRCHRTQFAPDSDFFKPPENPEDDWLSHEFFNRVESKVPASEKETDLFQGVRGVD